MDKIVLDRSKLLGFDHPSNLKAKVGVKNSAAVSNQPQAKPEVSRGRPRAGTR
jgi:hypothetical protein